MATARWKGQRYEIRVSCGRDINGKKIEKSITWKPDPGMTERQIQKELARRKVLFEQQVKDGVCPDGSIRFKQLSDRWIEEYGKPQLSPSTYNRYVEYLKRINQAIGHIRPKHLKPLHLNSFYKNLSEPGVNLHYKTGEDGKPIGDRCLAPKTIYAHSQLVGGILNTAVRWELIDRNVAAKATPPKPVAKDLEFLDENQTKLLIQLLADEPIQYRTMIILLIYTGLRRGSSAA